MLIFIQGSDPFLAATTFRQLKAKYLEKNDGAELITIDCDPSIPFKGSWADLQAVPLFATTRLVLIRSVGLLPVKQQDELAAYLDNKPDTTVVVLWDAKPLPKGALSLISDQAVKKISAEPLAGPTLSRWVATQAKKHSLELSKQQIDELIDRFGSNLYAHYTELQTMALTGTPVSSWKVETASEPFVLYRLLSAGKYQQLSQIIKDMAAKGEPAELIIAMLASATRKLTDVQKRLELTDMLADIDLGLKTGLVDTNSALALLISSLTHPARSRLQWDQAWHEIY